ncbi:hypothetical protein [Legionella jordanis]|uniref:Uncharacterized protein n=1 Tax=Legionella jordanis TaxID=456 RepID=A0A0W0VAZ4_9GAMM|nr:hypothetical protein [Legionella jordanis]KTD17298.1 hypothetical protein Ljor_1604 [Legionella jordanis]RMW99459.1 hypothetical protein EAW55_13720 [Legionella jordanis]RMX15308.1 hypothetical protein EAS68_12565 [Legionella jordanis]VEH12503.1 Uncharacterised protein [Legionella jordanis]
MLNKAFQKSSLIFFFSIAYGFAADIDHLRGSRYCEILVNENRLNLAVYNSIGINDCPEDLWNKIDIQCVKTQTGASFAKLNGPRYWVIDGLLNSKLASPEVQSICGLKLRKAGVLKLGLSDIMLSSQPYRGHTVDRHTTWIYKAGQPIYELIDPSGQIFVMQSYSIEKQAQTLDGLQNLNKILKLPPNWQFRSRVLQEDKQLPAVNNKATVVQDELFNTYQLAPQDF